MTDSKTESAAPSSAGREFLYRPAIAIILTQVLMFVVGTVAVSAYSLARSRSVFLLIHYLYDWWTIYFPVCSLLLGAGAISAAMKFGGVRTVLRAGVLVLVAGVLCFFARVYATHIEPKLLRVREETLVSTKVISPIRILHITDIQSGGVGDYEASAIQRMIDLDPDLIIHTGDLLHPVPPATFASELPKISQLLDQLHPRLGFFNVVGDTDGPILRQLQRGVGGMVTLENSGATIDSEAGTIELFGLLLMDSRDPSTTLEHVEPWLDSTSESDLRILFGHAPDYILAAQDEEIDLCLAGHTHGGQIRIPFYGPIMTMSAVPRDLALGWHQVGRTQLNVTAGIGAEHEAELPPIRVNCPPEMTLITILPDQ